MEFLLPHLEGINGLKELTTTCGRGENIVRAHTILNTKIKFCFSKYLFCILISLSQNPIKTN